MRKNYQLPTVNIITVATEAMIAASVGNITIGGSGDGDRIEGGDGGQLSKKQNDNWGNIWK